MSQCSCCWLTRRCVRNLQPSEYKLYACRLKTTTKCFSSARSAPAQDNQHPTFRHRHQVLGLLCVIPTSWTSAAAVLSITRGIPGEQRENVILQHTPPCFHADHGESQWLSYHGPSRLQRLHLQHAPKGIPFPGKRHGRSSLPRSCRHHASQRHTSVILS